MIKILIVDDELPIRELLRMSLSDAGFQCTCADNGLTAANLLENNHYDLVLLDIMLPHIDGYELLEYIKTIHTPVIFLTAKGSLNDRVKGLNLGAEDYIVKPFEIVELLARIHVVLRRYNKDDNIISIGNLSLDLDNKIAKKDNLPLDLTPKEFELLAFFMQNKNITLFRDHIYETVWGKDCSDETRTVDLHIQRLRKKTGLMDQLKTIYKVGYRLEDTEVH